MLASEPAYWKPMNPYFVVLLNNISANILLILEKISSHFTQFRKIQNPDTSFDQQVALLYRH